MVDLKAIRERRPPERLQMVEDCHRQVQKFGAEIARLESGPQSCCINAQAKRRARQRRDCLLERFVGPGPLSAAVLV